MVSFTFRYLAGVWLNAGNACAACVYEGIAQETRSKPASPAGYNVQLSHPCKYVHQNKGFY